MVPIPPPACRHPGPRCVRLTSSARRCWGVRSWVGEQVRADQVVASAPKCSPAGPILEQAPTATSQTIPSLSLTASATCGTAWSGGRARPGTAARS